jgi:hypothetical protein
MVTCLAPQQVQVERVMSRAWLDEYLIPGSAIYLSHHTDNFSGSPSLIFHTCTMDIRLLSLSAVVVGMKGIN